MFLNKLSKAIRQSLIILIFTVMVAIVFNLLRPSGIALLGFSSTNLIKQRQAQIPEISLSEAHDLYLQKKVILEQKNALIVFPKPWSCIQMSYLFPFCCFVLTGIVKEFRALVEGSGVEQESGFWGKKNECRI